MNAGLVAVVSCGVAVLGCLVNFWNATRSRESDRESDARWRGTVDAKLERILEDIQKILARQDAADVRLDRLEQRLTEVESRSKSNQHRLDERKNAS